MINWSTKFAKNLYGKDGHTFIYVEDYRLNLTIFNFGYLEFILLKWKFQLINMLIII